MSLQIAHICSFINSGVLHTGLLCGEREDLPLYGILIPSLSYMEDPLGRSGAGVAHGVREGPWNRSRARWRAHSLISCVPVNTYLPRIVTYS